MMAKSQIETRSFDVGDQTFVYPAAARFSEPERFVMPPELICDGQYVSLLGDYCFFRVGDGAILLNHALGGDRGRDPEKWQIVYESLAHWWASELMMELFLHTIPPEIEAGLSAWLNGDVAHDSAAEPQKEALSDPDQFRDDQFASPMFNIVRPAIIQLNKNTAVVVEELWEGRTNDLDMEY
jgi:hypothetical protein